MPLAGAARRADTLRVTSGASCGRSPSAEAVPGLRSDPLGPALAGASRRCLAPAPPRSGSDPRPSGTDGVTGTEGPDAAGEGRQSRKRRRRVRHDLVPAGGAPPLRAPPPLPGEGKAEAALRALAQPPAASGQGLLQSPPQHRLLLPSPARSIPATRDSTERSAQAPPPPSRPAPGTGSDLPGRGARRRGRAAPSPAPLPAGCSLLCHQALSPGVQKAGRRPADVRGGNSAF